ncbi:branched chain amino acid aminotransferase [Luteimonas chenhongjianii]|uniref:branched-chain-amino-acid transaminase n=1 Tax=Luteimonas chenhongjianii TaxID=2006110 RepID=A0A290XAN2_9GAMM|nr:branched chain amino acid aminotransferase [Luteimonas chenhongjianii]RPD84118.1 branched chain amino acid aminotransferase [Luteimonas sp. 100069]
MNATAEAAQAPPPSIAEPAVPARPQVWFDGVLCDIDALQAGLTTHAMHYGSGVFEGIRSYATADGAAVFRLPEHMARMREGAALLGMRFDPAQATDAVLATLRANRHRDAYIRPLTWFGEGGFGLDVEGHAEHLMVATTSTRVHLGGTRARLGISTWRRNPADSLPPLKLCGAYVNSILAKRESRSRGFDEALFTDADGFVVECTGANVFIVRAGRVTAVQHRDALPGITRDTLIRLSGAESRTVTLEELFDADEVFACGTAAEVAPVHGVEGRSYGDNPVTRELAALYARVVRGEAEAARGWLTAV